MTKDTQGKRYKVLTEIRDDESGRVWRAGQTLVDGDLDAAVIRSFLTMQPPALKVTKAAEEVDNGSDS